MSDQEFTDEQRKQKAEAAAQAREERRKAREARLKEQENEESASDSEDERRKRKAEAAAKAREERRKAREKSNENVTDEQKERKREAAAKAREERRKARAQDSPSSNEDKEDTTKPPSPNQPLLDKVLAILNEAGAGMVEESFINEADRHLPYVILSAEHWAACARKLKENSDITFNYLRNISGVDHETHMEVVYHLLSLHTGQDICVKVRTDRERPSIPSVTPIWTTANWPEREIFDLLGIDFPGHPDLRRIMMPDDWIGHPLRKDYEAFDPEV